MSNPNVELSVSPNATPEEYDALRTAYRAGKSIKFSHKGSVWTTSAAAIFCAHNYYRVMKETSGHLIIS